MLHALALGADWVWCADDDGRPEGPEVLATLLRCAQRHGLGEVSPVVVNIDDPDALAFPLRRGLVGGASGRNCSPTARDSSDDLLPGIASLMNGALFSADTIDKVGVPDLRLFVRGDEVEMHRRLAARSGIAFGTPDHGLPPSRRQRRVPPDPGGRMHTQYPDNETKRFFTYRNRGYLMAQPGMRKLLPQEYARFGWYFLIQQRPRGFREWLRLRKLGRSERFDRP